MPRRKKDQHQTKLSQFLKKIFAERQLSVREASAIAGCSQSVVHNWLQGAHPSENIDKLKRLANHFGYSLAFAVSGSSDEIAHSFDISQYYRESVVFKGLAHIEIKKLDRR